MTDKKFLHVHHINGLRSNNNIDNLRVLCIKCHSQQPNHSHLKRHPDYIEFEKKYGNLLFDLPPIPFQWETDKLQKDNITKKVHPESEPAPQRKDYKTINEYLIALYKWEKEKQ